MKMTNNLKSKIASIPTNKKLVINLMGSLVVFIINTLISFFLSPYIVSTLGVAANGYIQLAYNFINYMTVLTAVLNSVSSRFITVAIYQKNRDKAEEYYSSVFIGNVILILMLLIPVVILILKLDNFIAIPDSLINQVKVLFSLIFLNFFITQGFPQWSVAFNSTNNVYLRSIGEGFSNVFRVFAIVSLFGLFNAKLWFVGVATICSTILLQIWMFIGKKILLPELTFKKNSVKRKSLIEISSSGVWNSVFQIGNIFINGLDLLITNILVGPLAMGIVGIAKVFPNLLSTLGSTLTNSFTPNLTILFAQKKIKDLNNELLKVGKICIVLLGIPLSGFISFGGVFFKLWVPSQDSSLLQILSILACGGLLLTSGFQPLWPMFLVLNKLKKNTLIVVITGFISVITTILIVLFTDLDMFAVCGVSTLMYTFSQIFLLVPLLCKYLDISKLTFAPLLYFSVLNNGINIFIGILIVKMINPRSWTGLIICGILFVIISFLISTRVLLNNSERKALLLKL